MTEEKTSEVFEEYESLKLEEKKIKERLDELKPSIIEAVPEDKEIQLTYGFIKVQNRSTWKFSPAVDEAKKEVKKLEAEEKAKGIATSTTAPVVYYKEQE